MILVLALIFALFLVAGLSGTTRALVRKDAFPPGVPFGLRTSATKSSAEAWAVGHKAASGTLLVTTVVSAAGGVAVYLISLFAVGGVNAAVTWIAAGISLAATVVMIGIAFLVANSAASKLAV